MITGAMVALELAERGLRIGHGPDDVDELGHEPDLWLTDEGKIRVSDFVLHDEYAAALIKLFRGRLLTWMRRPGKTRLPAACAVDGCGRYVLRQAQAVMDAKKAPGALPGL